MAEHFNGLHPAEAERLALLVEECGEVIQAACKVLRHGYKSYDPTVRGGPDNQEALAKEMGDLRVAMELMLNVDVMRHRVDHYYAEKMISVPKWLHHNRLHPAFANSGGTVSGD